MTEHRERTLRAHPFSERKRVVELYESGMGSKRIARELGLDDSMVRLWLRRFRSNGLESLHPYWRESSGTGKQPGVRTSRRESNEQRFSAAFKVYATSLEPVASISRRYGLDYRRFTYHINRFHPELVEQRKRLSENVI